MSFNMGSGPQGAGSFVQTGSSFRQCNDFNAPPAQAQPQIYSVSFTIFRSGISQLLTTAQAVYSGVDVYEMEVNGIAVMRRRADSWLNATQILKVAGIEKGKRTKVLEKEILIGEHEKVQGGYGKYQGTWIKFEKGLEFCRQYGVEELLRPLLTYDMGQDGGKPGGGGTETPTKEQAMAAQRKRMYNAGSERGAQGGSGTFFKNISATASHAVAAISKARFDSPGPRMRGGTSNTGRQPSFSRQSSQQQPGDEFPASQQSMQSFASDATYTNATSATPAGAIDSAYATQSQGPVFSQQMGSEPQKDFAEPPRKRIRTSPDPSAAPSLSQQTEGYYKPLSQSQLREQSPTEANESFAYQNSMTMGQPQFDDPQSIPPLPFLASQAAESKRAVLMSLFMDPSRSDFSTHEAFLTLFPHDLDTPIDSKSHTALHWAATLARLPLIRALIEKGANVCRVNGSGETALMRAVAVTNCADMAAMPEVLEYLGGTIGIRDGLGRTVLHHIAITSAVKGRSQCSKYYLESLLEFVVRQGSAPSTQSTYPGSQHQQQGGRAMGIGRFMSEIVNAQDKRGDTALLFAARVNNRGIISQLIEVGADPGIGNKAGLRPVDYGIGELDIDDGQRGGKMVSSIRENSGDILTAIGEMVRATEEEFAQEMNAKQSIIDNLHASLRQTSSNLGQSTQQLKLLREQAKERNERVQKITSLRSAADEEGYRLQQLKAQLPSLDRSLNGEGSGEMSLGQPDSQFSPFRPGTTTQEIQGHMQANPSALDATVSKDQLRARIQAYKQNNQDMENRVAEIQRGSRKTQEKYRRVIALCTKTDENKLDNLLEGLWRSVESDAADVELGRVREFLSRVEGAE